MVLPSIALIVSNESYFVNAEIAVMSGFENLSCFCRMFRKEENATPSGYRKEWRSL
jgi:YesN/AraC family two-component response regulator